MNPTTNRVYVSAYRFGPEAPAFIFVVDGASLQIVHTIVTPCCPTDLDLNPGTNRLYALNGPGMTGYIVDMTSNTVVATFPAGNVPNDVAVDRTRNRIYSLRALGEIGVIDGATNAQTGTISVAFGPPQSGSTWSEIAVNETTQRLYALYSTLSGTDTGKLAIADATTLKAVGTVPAGSRPSGLAVNPVTGLVYVADGKTLFVIADRSSTEARLYRAISLE